MKLSSVSIFKLNTHWMEVAHSNFTVSCSDSGWLRKRLQERSNIFLKLYVYNVMCLFVAL